MRLIMRKVLHLVGVLILLTAFQNCTKVGFTNSGVGDEFGSKGTSDGRDPGDDTRIDDGRDPGDDGQVGDDRDPGDDDVVKEDDDDRETGDDDGDLGDEDDSDWLYIPGGRGHVPMSAVAICPADSKDAGKQKCPFFCFEGKDYVMHKSLAREYFAKHFDRQADYGGMAVPGTCAAPDLKNKRNQ